MYYDVILTKLRSGDIDQMRYAYRLYQQLRLEGTDLITDNEWKNLEQIMPKSESELYEEGSILSILSSINDPEKLNKLIKKVQKRREYLESRRN